MKIRWSGHYAIVFVLLLLPGCATQSSHPTPPTLSPTMGSTDANGSVLAQSMSSRARDDLNVIARGQPANASNVSEFKQEGRASWYGPRFHGRRTANGERFDKHALTAAHRRLPLSSFVRVINVTNKRSVVVRINDRGPFHSGRIIDLSQAAASALGLKRAGTAQVRLQGLSRHEGRVAMAEQLASAR